MTDPAPIHCPFTVIIDTREQAPWSFRGFTANADKKHAPIAVDCRTSTLATGDYSIAGFESLIAIERKSLSDAFSTFTRDRARWERELERMALIRSCHVIIEAGWDDILRGTSAGGAAVGKSVFRSILSWAVSYPNVHWWPMGSRELAEATAFRIFEKFWGHETWLDQTLANLGLDTSQDAIESGSSVRSRRSRGKSLPGLNS